MGIPTKVVAKPGHVVLIEDIPGKPRLRVRDSGAVNLLEHYTLQEIAASNGISSCIVNGLLIPHESTMDLPKEKTFGVDIPEGRLVSKTYQKVGIREVQGAKGKEFETVLDENDVEEIRKKVAGMSSGEKDVDETDAEIEGTDTEVILEGEGDKRETAAPVSSLERKRLDDARKRLESTTPRVLTKGTPPKDKGPVFSIQEFIGISENEKVSLILRGKIKDPKNLKSIRDRKINNGKNFSVRVRSAAGKILKNMGVE